MTYVAENGFGRKDSFSEQGIFSEQELLNEKEQNVARWVYENGKRAGATTHHFSEARCLYLAIRMGNYVYGVIGISMGKEELDSFAYSIVLSVINECALAMAKYQKCGGEREERHYGKE